MHVEYAILTKTFLPVSGWSVLGCSFWEVQCCFVHPWHLITLLRFGHIIIVGDGATSYLLKWGPRTEWGGKGSFNILSRWFLYDIYIILKITIFYVHSFWKWGIMAHSIFNKSLISCYDYRVEIKSQRQNLLVGEARQSISLILHFLVWGEQHSIQRDFIKDIWEICMYVIFFILPHIHSRSRLGYTGIILTLYKNHHKWNLNSSPLP